MNENCIYFEIDPRKIRLLPRNARYMRHETYQQLVANIQTDQVLTQDPFCAYWGYFTELDQIQVDAEGVPVLEVLSGNHRVKAAVAAGLEQITVKLWVKPLDQQKRLAMQLSHNALVGEDDPVLLRELYEEIADIDLRQYSGLDDHILGLMADVNSAALKEAQITFQTLNFTFLPEEMETVRKVWEEARKLVTGDHIWLVCQRDYHRFLDALETAGSAYSISNKATALMLILTVFQKHVGELTEGWVDEYNELLHERPGWVPIATVFGHHKLPAKSLLKVKKAIDHLVGSGQVPAHKQWEALPLIAEAYLKSVEKKEKE